MFNFGFSELFALAVIALLVIGPKQLPQVARNIARMLNEFKRITGQFTDPLKQTEQKMHDFNQQTKDFLTRAEENIEGYVRETDPLDRDEHHEPEPDEYATNEKVEKDDESKS